MVVTQGRAIDGLNAKFYGTPDAATAPASWTWQLRMTNPVDHQHDGSDAVSFDIDYPVRLNMPGTPAGADPVQYRTTVTSPWGIVEYTSAAI